MKNKLIEMILDVSDYSWVHGEHDTLYAEVVDVVQLAEDIEKFIREKYSKTLYMAKTVFGDTEWVETQAEAEKDAKAIIEFVSSCHNTYYSLEWEIFTKQSEVQ